MSNATHATTVRRTNAAHLTESERHSVLASERRRLVLGVLEDRTTPLSLSTLAEAVATRESDAAQPDAEAVERVTVSLYHHHLPRLADDDLVEYDAA
jgi:hypothetical protein